MRRIGKVRPVSRAATQDMNLGKTFGFVLIARVQFFPFNVNPSMLFSQLPACPVLQGIRRQVRVEHLNFSEVNLLPDYQACWVSWLSNVGQCVSSLGHSVHESHGEEEDEGLHKEPV